MAKCHIVGNLMHWLIENIHTNLYAYEDRRLEFSKVSEKQICPMNNSTCNVMCLNDSLGSFLTGSLMFLGMYRTHCYPANTRTLICVTVICSRCANSVNGMTTSAITKPVMTVKTLPCQTNHMQNYFSHVVHL